MIGVVAVAVLADLVTSLLILQGRYLPGPTADGKALFPSRYEEQPDVPAGSKRWLAVANEADDRRLRVDVPRRPRAYSVVVFCTGGEFLLDADIGEVSGPCRGRVASRFGAYTAKPGSRWTMTTTRGQPGDWGFAVYLWPPGSQ